MTEDNMIRIRYAENESGWAEKLEGSRARIANVPYADGLNIDDVVELVALPDGLLYAGRVVTSAFACKAALNYPEPHVENWKKLNAALRGQGCKVEGVIRGLCVVAYAENVDPVVVAKAAGVDASVLKDNES